MTLLQPTIDLCESGMIKRQSRQRESVSVCRGKIVKKSVANGPFCRRAILPTSAWLILVRALHLFTCVQWTERNWFFWKMFSKKVSSWLCNDFGCSKKEVCKTFFCSSCPWEPIQATHPRRANRLIALYSLISSQKNLCHPRADNFHALSLFLMFEICFCRRGRREILCSERNLNWIY